MAFINKLHYLLLSYSGLLFVSIKSCEVIHFQANKNFHLHTILNAHSPKHQNLPLYPRLPFSKLMFSSYIMASLFPNVDMSSISESREKWRCKFTQMPISIAILDIIAQKRENIPSTINL